MEEGKGGSVDFADCPRCGHQGFVIKLRFLSESRITQRTQRTRKKRGLGKIYKHIAPMGLVCVFFGFSINISPRWG